jgi:hypothetical protein
MAGFWTNRDSHLNAGARIHAGMPEDSFYGSRVVIIPSERTVIVRFGLTQSPGFDIRGLLDLVSDSSSAFKNP